MTTAHTTEEGPGPDLAGRLRILTDRRSRLFGLITDIRGSVRGMQVGRPATPEGGRPVTPFDDLVSSVTSTLTDGPRRPDVPPPSRFMVRVARTARPHRVTKRNYDYFDELTTALDAMESERRQPRPD